MKLKDYIHTRNFTITEFAFLVGITPTALHNYLSKRRKPKLDIAQRIIEKTRGKVTLKDLLDD